MSEFVTTGSKNIIEGNEVDIVIKIARNGDSFELSGTLRVIEVSNIIDMSQARTVKFKKGQDSPSAFNFNTDKNSYYYKTNNAKLQSFEIIITGTKNPNFQNSGNIKVEIPLKDESTETINFEVVAHEKPIRITEFIANNRIIQQGGQALKNLKLTYAIEGEAEKVILFENAKELNTFTSQKQSEFPIKYEDTKMSGLYEYTLQATKGSQMVSQSIMVIYVKKSSVEMRLKPDNWTIINFCTAQNGDYFFALMSHDKDKTLQIGYTDQIDGSENWSIIKITDQEKMKLFVSSPMLHLQSENEKYDGKLGRLLFIGGSMIGKITKAEAAGNQVAIIDLGEEGNNISLKPLPTYFFGHSCVLFCTATDPNTIWLLGGQDEYGVLSNKIWTSADGKTWNEYKGNIPWAARVMASTTVSLEYINGKRKPEALWLAGGFENFGGFGGNFRADAWRYDMIEGWKQINKVTDPLPINSRACAVAYGERVNLANETGLFVLGALPESKESNYFMQLNLNIDKEYKWNDVSPPIFVYGDRKDNIVNQGVYVTAFFRECLWVMGLNDKGAEGIGYSELYYRIPTISGKTIDIYNEKMKLNV